MTILFSRLLLTLLCLVTPLRGDLSIRDADGSGATRRMVLSDFQDKGAWDLARDNERLQKELESWDFLLVDKPVPHLDWRFSPRHVHFNDLFLRESVSEPFSRFIVNVRNMGAPIRFAIKLKDKNGAEWTVNPVLLSRDDVRRELEFRMEDFHVASWSSDQDGRLSFPTRFVAFIASGLKQSADYALQIDRIELELDPLPRVQILEMDLPERLQAGEKVKARLKLTLLSGSFHEERAALELVQDQGVLSSFPLRASSALAGWKGGQERSFWTDKATAGSYIVGGEYQWRLRLSGSEAELISGGSVIENPRVEVVSRQPGPVVAEVRTYLGAPKLFINGKPHSGMAYAAYRPYPEFFDDFTGAGVNLFSITSTPTACGYGKSKDSWLAPDTFDFSQLDERVGIILEANRDAYIFPRLYLFAPQWWCREHPDEIVRYDPGDGNPVLFLQGGDKLTPSWASEVWRNDTAMALRKLIDYVDKSPYADRIIGYHLASGVTDEWMQWGSYEDQWVDYSPANTRAFRIWLVRKYGSSESLRLAWNDPTVSLETAIIPAKKERMKASLGMLRDPVSEQSSIDYDLYTSDLVAETIRYFASVVKEATRREKIVGVFHGYVLQLAGSPRMQNSGHLALREVWDCPDIDFISSPTSYAFRQIGTGTSYTMSLLDGVMLAGKLWFNENDIRTALSPGKVGKYGKPASNAGDMLLQRRELTGAITRGYGQWWFDAGGNRYDEPALMAELSKLRQHADDLVSVDRSPVDEVAFVIDSKSIAYMKVGNQLGRHLIKEQIPHAARIGAPVGWYELSDLAKLPPRRMYVFLNIFAPSDKDVTRIRSLMTKGRVLVFVYAPGVYRGGRFDPSAAKRLLGFPLKFRAQSAELKVRVVAANPILENIRGIEFGTDSQINGYFTTTEEGGSILGRLTNGDPGLLVRKEGNSLIVYSAAPTLPTALLRRLAKAAGIHLYIDSPDVVWATRELLAVSVNEPGKRTVKLPEVKSVFDVYEGKVVSERTESFEASFSRGETKLWRLSNP